MKGRAFFRPIGLRGLLFALALGTLAFPLSLGLLVASLVSGGINEQPINRFSAVMREVRKAVRIDEGQDLSPRAGYLPPAWLGLIVADTAGKVVYSSFPSLPAGSPVDQGTVASLALSLGLYGPPSGPLSAPASAPGSEAPACFYAETVESARKVLGSYYALIPPIDLRASQGREFSAIRLLALGILALFALILAAIVSTILAGAVVRLERAAGRMAAGDLETKVHEVGVREIGALAEAMERMRISLRENKDRRNRFLAAVSHDLRTPLTSIAGYLEAVEDGLADEPETLARYVGIMRDKTSLLEERIAGLLEFARMETGEWRMGFEPVDLGDFLAGLSGDFGQDAALVGRAFSSSTDEARGIEVNADLVLLRRAFENILSNALRYSPPGATIRLEARRERSALVVTIDDEGPGIAQADRERIFEPFYRGSAAREGEGNGLGLYIALSVIEGHGWSLSAGASPLGGARFSIAVPSGLIA